MPLFGKKDSTKKVRKDGHKDIDKQIINIEDKYHLRQVLGKWVLNIGMRHVPQRAIAHPLTEEFPTLPNDWFLIYHFPYHSHSLALARYAECYTLIIYIIWWRKTWAAS